MRKAPQSAEVRHFGENRKHYDRGLSEFEALKDLELRSGELGPLSNASVSEPDSRISPPELGGISPDTGNDVTPSAEKKSSAEQKKTQKNFHPPASRAAEEKPTARTTGSVAPRRRRTEARPQ